MASPDCHAPDASSSRPACVAPAARWLLFVDNAAIRSWAEFQAASDSCPAAVSTNSGVQPRSVSAWAWVSSEGMVVYSSRVLHQSRGLVANAWTWLSAGSGSADQKDVGS